MSPSQDEAFGFSLLATQYFQTQEGTGWREGTSSLSRLNPSKTRQVTFTTMKYFETKGAFTVVSVKY